MPVSFLFTELGELGESSHAAVDAVLPNESPAQAEGPPRGWGPTLRSHRLRPRSLQLSPP